MLGRIKERQTHRARSVRLLWRNKKTPPLSRVDIGLVEDVPDCLDKLYYDIVNILVTCAKNFVPIRHKCFYKFWWDEELDTLKEAALESDKLWKDVGKPQSGPLFNNRQRACLLYRQRIREGKRSEDFVYMNELNDALIKKNGPAFWKSGSQNLNRLTSA